MNIQEHSTPREFQVGFPENKIFIQDCAHIKAEPNEQVTFKTDSGTEYDVARKDWGYYATPSINGRLKNFHLQSALVKNSKDQYYLMLVEEGKEYNFRKYLQIEKQELVCWLNDKNLTTIKSLFEEEQKKIHND